MNEQHSIWWDIFEVVSKWVALIVAAGFGWLTSRFSSMEVRMDTIEDELQKRTQESAMHIAVLQSYHVANTQRLDSIEDTTQRMDAKLDRLIERGR